MAWTVMVVAFVPDEAVVVGEELEGDEGV